MDGWNITQLGMPNIIPVQAHKSQEVMNSPKKLVIIEEIFLDIGKQMLEINYTLNLGQLLKITSKIKRYLQQKLYHKKTQNFSKTTTKKEVNSLV